MPVRNFFSSLEALTNSDFFKSLPKKALKRTDRVLKSLRIEDMIYADTRAHFEDILSGIELAGAEKLPTIGTLTRDVFQSLYAFTPRYTPEAELTPYARKINRHILGEIMRQDDYPVLKAICEGRALLAMEATVEFMQKLSDRLDGLIDSANGDKKLLGTLDKQERAQKQRIEDLAVQDKQRQAATASNTALDNKLLP